MNAASRVAARRRVRLDRPALAVLLGALGVAVVIAIVGVRLGFVAFDEAVYKLAAAQYADRFPRELLDDTISRGVARLYALTLMPLVAVFDGDVAVRLGRALNGVWWALTAVPVFLLARRVAGPGLAAAAAVLSVAVPWLTLATILFSESLAYLLFACVLLAMVRALERPGLVADALVVGLLVALVLTRVQFVVLVPAWVVLVACLEWPRRRDLRGVARRRPVLAAGAVGSVLALLVVVVAGGLDRVLRELGGPYEGLRDRESFPGDFGLAALFEVEMLAIGVGVVPAILAAAWGVEGLAGRMGEIARRVALVGVVMVAAVFAGTLFAQGGWLDSRSEERYYIYAVPVLWVFAVAALERRVATPRLLVAGGLALAAVAAVVPITVQDTRDQIFLGPVSRIVQWGSAELRSAAESVTGIDGVLGARDVTALVVLLVALVAAWALRRGRRPAALVVLAPAVALQLLLCVVAVKTIEGGLGATPSLVQDAPFATLGWVDRAPGTDSGVTLVQEDVPGIFGLVYWNDRVLDGIRPVGAVFGEAQYPVNRLRAAVTEVGPDLRLTVPPGRPLVVGRVDSPTLQIAGETVARSADGLFSLRRPGPQPAAEWSARGLEPDGHVVADVAIASLPRRRVVLSLVPPAPFASTRVEVTLGGASQSYDAASGERRDLTFDLCGETGPVAGTIVARSSAPVAGDRQSGARLERVRSLPC